MKDKILEVSAIENGTVIDHIPPKAFFKVIAMLRLDKLDNQMTLGTNLHSKKIGKKAIVKLSDIFFPDKDVNKIALVAPQAKLNIIRNYDVVEKRVVEIPDDIVGIVKCMNPKCITNSEKIETRFKVVSKKEVQLKCLYCEKITDQDNMEVI